MDDRRYAVELADGPGAGSALDDLAVRDEILQVIYWYQGEGFGTTVAARDLQTFLTLSESTVAAQLERLVTDGYLRRVGQTPAPSYAFTPYGEQEGARRFADEFSGLTGQAHGDCPPNCPHCKDLPADQCVHCSPRGGSDGEQGPDKGSGTGQGSGNGR
ncbi:MAG TPA: hypothetical protein VFM49_04105 [Chloroflexia bacterium]|jgi:hypothetical protein|nr:hypothetical protein [Chloroflexia bacterium]